MHPGLQPADVVLRPHLSGISFMDFTEAPAAIAEGRACVLRNLPALQYALDQEGIPHRINAQTIAKLTGAAPH